MVSPMTRGRKAVVRCAWVGDKPHMIRYHDDEWGRPVHDDRRHFEMLVLEGAQAGLSWDTILRRREGYRRAFAEFDPVKVAKFDARKTAALLKDAGIIRNRLKIDAAVTNAQAFIEIQEEFGSFDRYVWPFVGGDRKSIAGRVLLRCRPPVRRATRCPKTSRNAASALSGVPSSMPICRPSAW